MEIAMESSSVGYVPSSQLHPMGTLPSGRVLAKLIKALYRLTELRYLTELTKLESHFVCIEMGIEA
jgi:hypothetical protein